MDQATTQVHPFAGPWRYRHMFKSPQQYSTNARATPVRQPDPLELLTQPPPTVSIGPDEFMVAAYGEAGRQAVAHVAGQLKRDSKP